MLSNTPSRLDIVIGHRWVVEDAEEDQGIGGVALLEVGAIELQTEGYALHHCVTHLGKSVEVSEYGLAESGNVLGKEVGPVKGDAGLHTGIVGTELRPEVKAFFCVGLSGGEIAAHREVAPPRAAAVLHADAELFLEVLPKEAAAEPVEPALERFVDPVAEDVEEAVRGAGTRDPRRRDDRVPATSHEGRNVDHRELRFLSRSVHSPLSTGTCKRGCTL